VLTVKKTAMLPALPCTTLHYTALHFLSACFAVNIVKNYAARAEHQLRNGINREPCHAHLSSFDATNAWRLQQCGGHTRETILDAHPGAALTCDA
jgi:hypothetical protein